MRQALLLAVVLLGACSLAAAVSGDDLPSNDGAKKWWWPEEKRTYAKPEDTTVDFPAESPPATQHEPERKPPSTDVNSNGVVTATLPAAAPAKDEKSPFTFHVGHPAHKVEKPEEVDTRPFIPTYKKPKAMKYSVYSRGHFRSSSQSSSPYHLGWSNGWAAGFKEGSFNFQQ